MSANMADTDRLCTYCLRFLFKSALTGIHYSGIRSVGGSICKQFEFCEGHTMCASAFHRHRQNKVESSFGGNRPTCASMERRTLNR